MAEKPCTHWDGSTATRCGAVPSRPFIQGLRCQSHTPAALAAEPEPGRTAYSAPAWPDTPEATR